MTPHLPTHLGAVEPDYDTVGSDDGLTLYRTMYLVRRFEELAQSLFRRGHIKGSIHLCMGQEAVGVGVCSIVQPGDLVAATYRGHAPVLALGADPVAFLAELLGRRTGICGGRAGSMNVVDLEHGLLGCFGIVGASLAAATGAAFGLRRQGSGVATAFFGDGAANQAYFFESLNLAAVQALPVVFVCENNGYGEFTATGDVTPGGIAARAEAMKIQTRTVDGQNVWSVRSAAAWAFSEARSGRGPVFLEALTYRFNDHARGDPVDYRPAGELESWRKRDPLTIAADVLTERYGIDPKRLAGVRDEVAARVLDVRATALAQEDPDPLIGGREFSPGRDGAVDARH